MTSPDNRQPGQIPQGELLVSPEKRLAGKTAIVTGGSRDIGAGIVQALALEGVSVVSSLRDKQKRADKVSADIQSLGGVSPVFVQTDFSDPSGRESFSDAALASLDNKVDFLILNSSGDSAALNKDTSQDLVDRALPFMSEGGVIIRLQSVPGHFDPQLRGLGKMISIYDDVAKNKREDEVALRARQQEMADKGIRLITVIPPVVPDTSNMKLFNFVAKREGKGSAEEMHDEISDMLGLPRVVDSKVVASKVVDLLVDGDIPSGHTEFFNGVSDVQTVLENWYGTAQVGVQTLERADILGMPVGVGRSIVSKEQVERPGEAQMIDVFEKDDEGNYVGVVNITKDHAIGHLNTEKGLPLIFPGHKQIRAAFECAEMFERNEGNSPFATFQGFESAIFQNPVLADGMKTLHIKPTLLERGDKSAIYDVSIVDKDGGVVSEIKGMKVGYASEKPENTLPRDFIIEVAAQTAGVFLAKDIGEDVMPLFAQVGPVTFNEVDLKPGAGVQYVAVGERTKNGIKGMIKVISGGEEIATIDGIQAAVLSKRIAFRMLKFKPS